MPRSMKMAEIKRILQIKELNRDFSNRQIGKIVNCSKDTVKVILSLADTLSITYEKIFLEFSFFLLIFAAENERNHDISPPFRLERSSSYDFSLRECPLSV